MDIKCAFAKAMKILLRPPALNNCIIDSSSKVCSQSELTNCKIGKYSYLGYNCFAVNARIGNYCSIADRVSIGGAMHPIEYVSSSPVFHEGKNVLRKNFSTHSVEETPISSIGNDVWIGQGAYIKAGVVVGDGSVIGMGAVVTKSIGPYEIWAGNPAHFIRKRFDDEIAKKLLESKWWEKEDEEIKKLAPLFNDPVSFIEEINKTGNL